MVESQGKVSEKSGNFEMDIEWQPCIWYERLSKFRQAIKFQLN